MPGAQHPEPTLAERAASPPRWLILTVFALLGVGYVLTVPLGEAPDEAAHIFYAGYLLDHGTLPAPPGQPDAFNYQAHHPPLQYWLGVTLLRTVGLQRVTFPAQPNPDLRFDNTGSRAFLPMTWTPAERSPLLVLRLLSLMWGLVTVASLMWLLETACADSATFGGALWTFALVPQLLFVCATVNNDSAAIALSTAALAALAALARAATDSEATVAASDPPLLLAMGAGLLVALGPFAKATAFFLLAPTALLLLVWLRKSWWKLAAALSLPVGAGLAAWFGLCWWRFGALWPPPPTGYAGGLAESLERVVELRWLASVWLSFWAKFGWFNLPLPWQSYLIFLVPTTAIAFGLVRWVRELSPRSTTAGEETRQDRAKPQVLGPLLFSALAMNGLLLLLFLLRVDFQPQGRFLLPSVGVFAVFASWGLQESKLTTRESSWRWSLAIAVVMILVNVCCLAWIRSTYLLS